MRADSSPGHCFAVLGRWLALGALVLLPSLSNANGQPAITADKLLKTGQLLIEKTHYLEALDLLEEAKDLLTVSGKDQTAMCADVLFSLAQAKIKARLHQDFPAYYVKTALQEIQAANKLRDKLGNVLPQKLAEGYYLEGYIQKKFFMRKNAARLCFKKATAIDPGSAPAKRELYELEAENKK
ncbi:MAG: hypothetical protein WBG50_09610 [Desulfomonilaceae bacterium]